ncbi:hypothetical protein DPEC_G00105020 [Dallia pectoralis]|uniref:Uncharacterized protein n=1 Tax=Dallia pectoralis TaxID=75939 RepID=A0ACC2GY74_DALPE|nr:hypothetical protein DPEC_G00105020 [Dallia pectoralis]
MLRFSFRRLLTNPVAGQTRKMSGANLAGSQKSLSGMVAIVTASTDGIGLAAARALGQRGAHVVVSSRRQSNVDRAVELLEREKIQVTGTTCNVGKSEDRERLVNMTVEQCGGVDILVSNAAVNPFFGNIMDSTEAVWDKILDVNVKSAFLMTKLVVPHMEKRRGGSVVFVSSVAGYQPMPALGPYSVSKTALLGLTRALAPELAQSNIRVNCVAPGIIKTSFSEALWQNEDILGEFKKQLSIKRVGEPEEIGGTVEQCGGVDILVSNAALDLVYGNIMDSTEADWDKILDVNVKSAFLLTKLVVPHMKKRRGGSVVFVSSVAGYQPIQVIGPYSVSKTALLGLTRALAPELAQSNIWVNCVAPGIIKTIFSEGLWQNEDILGDFKKQLSIKRAGEPEEIGGVIAFLCSKDASYITGETITATGGWSCRL